MPKAVATRSIGISRVLQFFREGNADEVRAVMPLVIEAVGARHLTINGPIAVAPDPAVPREIKRRHRRTKAELEQARLNSREAMLARETHEATQRAARCGASTRSDGTYWWAGLTHKLKRRRLEHERYWTSQQPGSLGCTRGSSS